MDRKLLDYYPVFMQEIKEIHDLCSILQAEIEETDEGILRAIDECYLSSASKYGVSRMEKAAGVKPPGSDTLEERKFRLEILMGNLKVFTMGSLEDFLSKILGEEGYSITLNNDNYTLIIKVALGSKKQFADALEYVKSVVPANLVIDMDLMYNKHRNLKTFTHNELHTKTHAQIRNEVLMRDGN